MTNPARTRTVQNTLSLPGTSAPFRPQNVTIRLNVPAFADGGSVEKIRTRYVYPDATGLWSVDLEVNADLDPAGTSYTVHEAAGVSWTFIVPAGSGTVQLRDILVDAPTNPDPMVAGVPLPGGSVPAGYVWTTTGGGEGDYAAGGGGGGGAVDSVNGQTGVVVLDAADVGAEPSDADLTAIAALTTTVYGRALLTMADAAATRTVIGLGNVDNTADASKPISTAVSGALAAKADLVGGLVPTSQIPALALTTSVVVASQAAMLALTTTQVQPGDLAIRTDGAGTFILTATDPSVLSNWTRLNAPTDAVTTVNGQTGTVVLAASDVGAQPVDSDLTAIAALTTTSYGRSFLALADAAAGRTLLGLGTLATQSGTFSGTSSGTNTGDQDLSALAPKASPTFTGTPTAPTASVGTNTTQLATTAFVLANGGGALNLTKQAKTANYTAVLGEMVLCDTTGGTFTVTLPAASGGKGTVVVKWTAGTVAPIIAVTGSDHIDTSTGSTGGAFTLLNQAARYESDGTALWIIGASNFALSTLDTRYTLAGAGGISGQWGDGSDGTVTISADTTLSRDMYYDNLTVNSGKTLFTNGWRVYVRNTCTNNGTIGAPGVQVGGGTNNFGSGTGGGATNALNAGKNGGNGGSAAAGVAGTAASNVMVAGNGGAGGLGSGGAGAAGGVGTAIAASALNPKSPLSAFTALMYASSGLVTSAPIGGAGGGGGGGDGTNNGGGGGGGGGVVLLNARILVNNGSITADGEAGRSPITGNVGGGGGGAGGAVFVNTTSSTGTGTITANGGAGGTKVGTGVNGSAGAAGFAQTIVWTV